MLLSIILPCYNPPENWSANIIAEYNALSEAIKEDIEVILVVDGVNIALDKDIEGLYSKIPSFKCIRYDVNRGKGFALRKGVEESKGELLIYTDIDFPYTTNSFLKIYSTLKNKECELAVGIKNDAYYAHVPLSRRILSKGLRKLIRFFLSIPITDTQCGLKGFAKEMKPVFLNTTIERYLFDLEFIRMAYKLNHKIKPVQIELNKNVHFRAMNYRILWPEMFNFLKLVIKPNTND